MHFKKISSKEFRLFLRKDKWPPKSPDLNPLDFYYWDAVVTRMLPLCPFTTTLEQFKDEIVKAINMVPLKDIQAALGSVDGRMREVENNGGKTIKN